MTTTTTALQALTACQAACERIIEQEGQVHFGIDFAALLGSVRAALSAPAAQDAPSEPARPDLLEKLTYHRLERDDLTLDELLSALASGWKAVRGRTERQMLLQFLDLMASQPATPAQDAAATMPDDKALIELRDGFLPSQGETFDTLAYGRAVRDMTLLAERGSPCDLCGKRPSRWIPAEVSEIPGHYCGECGPATPAAHPVAGQGQAVPELRERLGMAHDASLDDEHRECRAILMEIIRMLDAAPTAPQAPALVPLTEHHKLDTDRQVFFYEQDFYILSNFSSFALRWNGLDFPTSEHAYHWEKFNMRGEQQAECRNRIHGARSAHDAFKVASELKPFRRADWDDVKVGIMRDILRTKANQHEYVRRKLLATGDRELVEDSWRDDYWGWGPNRDGQNMLGKLWMEVRAELKAGITPTTKEQQ